MLNLALDHPNQDIKHTLILIFLLEPQYIWLMFRNEVDTYEKSNSMLVTTVRWNLVRTYIKGKLWLKPALSISISGQFLMHHSNIFGLEKKFF